VEEKKHIRLSELNKRIKEVIQDNFSVNIWIVAEIGEIKFNRNGHAYLELIEKDSDSDKIIAKTSATIWSYTLRMLKPYFETSTGHELEAGLKILISVSVEFHELYGFSLNIRDIDPAYTLGDIELRRLEIINRLTNDGVISMNKEIELPEVIQKIAVISSQTAAGYQDFMEQLNKNKFGYQFYCKLFPAIMQGEQTESSIISALDAVYGYEDFFDVVVIIRGGGSRSDLMWFDNYNLSYYITQFPLPIISGIGHEKDFSIADIVSHTSLKTPTAVAEFLVSRMAEFDQKLDEFTENIVNISSDFFENKYNRIESLANILIPLVQKKLHAETNKINLSGQKISLLAKSIIEKRRQKFDFWLIELKKVGKTNIKWKSKELMQYAEKLKTRLSQVFQVQQKKLEHFSSSVQHFNPENVLKKGYSITKANGKILTDSSEVTEGQILETILYKGKLSSKVQKKI
jgi:exodeoxyribonuclease VII large subunit